MPNFGVAAADTSAAEQRPEVGAATAERAASRSRGQLRSGGQTEGQGQSVLDSEFGHERRAGPPFTCTAPRELTDTKPKQGSETDGPNFYSETSMTKAPVTKFSRAPRNTMQGWLTGPGLETVIAALYVPSELFTASLATGGGRGSASTGSLTPRRASGFGGCSPRFQGAGRKMPTAHVPGPGSYTPRYRCSSNFK